MDLFQMINERPGFSTGGKFWQVPQGHSVANQYDDNDLDVAYYTQVGNVYKLNENSLQNNVIGFLSVC